jgi:menaquinone-dependent protoporphyrinogen IX oxidase
MGANKTLIAFESKGGATIWAAREIADVLRSKYGLEVDLVNLRLQKEADLTDLDLDDYQNIVIGSGVRVAKVYDKALKFLENDFTGKRTAFFVLSGEAGNPKTYENAKVKFVEETLAKYPKVNPVAAEAFGGRIRILGISMYDGTNSAKVKAWAEELGKKFAQ